MLRPHLTRLAALVIALAATAPAAAQESPLAQVPAKAPLVVQVHGYPRTKDRLMTMVKNAIPDFGGLVEASIDEQIINLLDERELNGLDPDGPIFIAFTELPKPEDEVEPPVAFVLRVTDYAQFRDGFLTKAEKKTLKKYKGGFEVVKFMDEKDLFLVSRKGYAILTTTREAAVLYTKAFEGLDAKLGQEAAAEFLRPDLAVYVDLGSIMKVYREEIANLRQLLEMNLQQEQANPFGGSSKEDLDKFFEALKDAETLLVGLTFQPDGLAVRGEVVVRPGSKTSKAFQGHKPQALTEIGTLPAGFMVYGASAPDKNAANPLQPFMQPLLTTPDSKEGKELKALLDQTAQTGAGLTLEAGNIPSGGIMVSEMDDPRKTTELQLKILTLIGKHESLQKPLLIKNVTVKPNAQTHRGFELHAYTYEIDLEAIPADQPEQQMIIDAMKKIFAGKQQAWFGTDGKVFVQVAGRNWAEAQKTLDQFFDKKNSIGGQKSFQMARKQLPAQASELYLIHSPALVSFFMEFFYAGAKAAGLPDLGPLPKPALKPGQGDYLGFAVATQDTRGRFDLWIPGSMARDIQKAVEPIIKKLIQDGGGIQP